MSKARHWILHVLFQRGNREWNSRGADCRPVSEDSMWKARLKARRSNKEIWTIWKDGLTERVQQCIPHRTTVPKRDLPWVDYELKKLIRRRDRIHKKWKKTGGDELYAAFRALKRLRQTKETVLGTCGHPDFRSNSRSESTWKQTAKEFPHWKKEASWSQVMQRKLKYWTGNSSQPTAQRKKEEFATRCPMPQLDPTVLCEDINITVSGIEKLPKQLNPTKASGPDDTSHRGSCIRDRPITNPELQSLYEVWHCTKGLEICPHRPRVQESGSIQALNLPAPLPHQHILQISWARGNQHHHGICRKTPNPYNKY